MIKEYIRGISNLIVYNLEDKNLCVVTANVDIVPDTPLYAMMLDKGNKEKIFIVYIMLYYDKIDSTFSGRIITESTNKETFKEKSAKYLNEHPEAKEELSDISFTLSRKKLYKIADADIKTEVVNDFDEYEMKEISELFDTALNRSGKKSRDLDVNSYLKEISKVIKSDNTNKSQLTVELR